MIHAGDGYPVIRRYQTVAGVDQFRGERRFASKELRDRHGTNLSLHIRCERRFRHRARNRRVTNDVNVSLQLRPKRHRINRAPSARVGYARQRADYYRKMGALKSEAGERSIPLAPMLANTLREWKLVCPKSELGLVFPNGVGRIESHANIVNRGFIPVQIVAGITTANGKAKYTGLHSLRHFYASWCINRRVDGGLELPLKIVQARLGHASVQMTADRYGHLFPRGDDGAELATAEQAFLS